MRSAAFLRICTLVFALIVSGRSKADRTGDCVGADEQHVEKCIKPIVSYASKLETALPLDGMKIFNELCELYHTFQQCTDELDCESPSVNALKASYGYMCGDGHKQFALYANCFVEVEQVKNYIDCKDKTMKKINELSTKTDDMVRYIEDLCTLMTRYLECSRPTILNKCGKGAWKLVAKVTGESLAVSMPKCDVSGVLQTED